MQKPAQHGFGTQADVTIAGWVDAVAVVCVEPVEIEIAVQHCCPVNPGGHMHMYVEPQGQQTPLQPFLFICYKRKIKLKLNKYIFRIFAYKAKVNIDFWLLMLLDKVLLERLMNLKW